MVQFEAFTASNSGKLVNWKCGLKLRYIGIQTTLDPLRHIDGIGSVRGGSLKVRTGGSLKTQLGHWGCSRDFG